MSQDDYIVEVMLARPLCNLSQGPYFSNKYFYSLEIKKSQVTMREARNLIDREWNSYFLAWWRWETGCVTWLLGGTLVCFM